MHSLPLSELRKPGCWLAWVLLLVSTRASLAQTLARRSFTTANGLLQSSVYCLGQDYEGRLWAGTQAGVCSYDGQEFRSYGGKQGLADTHVRAVAPAPNEPTVWLGLQYAGLAALRGSVPRRAQAVRVPGLHQPGRLAALWAAPGQVWLGTDAQGLWQLSFGEGRPDTLARHYTTAQGLPADSVGALGPGLGHGRLWAATPRGLGVLDARTGRPLPAEQAALPAALRGPIYDFCRASDSVAWVGTPRGLLRISATSPGKRWRLRRFTTADGLCANAVPRVALDAAGRVWASTAAGLCQGTPNGHTGYRFSCAPGQEPIDGERRRAVLADREGNVWGAVNSGLDQLLAGTRFAQFTAADGLPNDIVFAVAQLGPGQLWVGTDHDLGLLTLGPAGPLPPLRRLAVPSRGGGGHQVRSLLADSRGRMWVGTFHDGARRYDPGTGRWELLDQLPGLAGQTVASMAEDNRGRVWLVTHGQGVTVYDPSTNTYRTYRAPERGLPSCDFWQVYRDTQGRLWLASDDAGLVAIDTRYDTFRRVDTQPGRLSLGSISDDGRGGLWLASINRGLLRYAPHTGQLRDYGSLAGLHSLNPYFVRCDGVGQVWVGTHLGVDVVDARTGRVRSYGRDEGFSGGETNQNAVWLAPDGRLWMGTIGGIMLHDPRQPSPVSVAPPTLLMGLRVGLRDTALRPGLRLPARLNDLSFAYRGVSLARPGSVRYQYRLRGLADTWVGPEAGTSATFANLAPGRYTFEVRASTGEGGWSRRPASFAFEIALPWWRRWWALGLYAAALAGLLWLVRRRAQQQERERAERALERQAISYLQELDRVKTDFFTNISHELRTPLTLILGPAELLADTAPDPGSRQRGQLVLGQARKLLALINQLLDLSKLDAGALRLRPTPGDVSLVARQLIASFGSLAERQQVALILDTPAKPIPLVFDAEKLDEVLTNLLANALRFTPAGGRVTVAVRELAATPTAPAGAVEIAVRDTGPGIGAAHLPHLFDRFYQAGEASGSSQGTGIGLALVRELVQLHSGTVAAYNEPGAGACFVVWLPRSVLAAPVADTGATSTLGVVAGSPKAAASPAANAPITAIEPPATASAVGPAGTASATLSSSDAEPVQVLLIEDSDEVRGFVAEALAPAGYHLLLAADGAAGLALARAEVPDLIISDVMMPGLSGYEVCAALQADAATSHIPVVLLTARSAADDRLRGLETGAQAYLPKPFRPRELQAQVRSLLQLSQQTRARFAVRVPPPLPTAAATAGADELATSAIPAALAVLPNYLAAHQAAVAALPSLDQAFLQQLDAAVLAHLADEAYGVDQLSADLNLSRTQLHRKLKALTGQAPGEYLRHTRLLRALALLQARVGTVAEVAYQVGYANPAHFSTAFSRHFGYPPSAVRVA